MNVKPRTPCQPSLDLGMLMRGVVVDDEMNIEVTGDIGLDVAQKLEEVLVTMTGLALGYHFSGGDVQRGEQGGSAPYFSPLSVQLTGYTSAIDQVFHHLSALFLGALLRDGDVAAAGKEVPAS